MSAIDERVITRAAGFERVNARPVNVSSKQSREHRFNNALASIVGHNMVAKSVDELVPLPPHPCDVVARKMKLKEKIEKETKNLEEIRKFCQDKELSITVRFFLYDGKKDGVQQPEGRTKKDLDNLLKIPILELSLLPITDLKSLR